MTYRHFFIFIAFTSLLLFSCGGDEASVTDGDLDQTESEVELSESTDGDLDLEAEAEPEAEVEEVEEKIVSEACQALEYGFNENFMVDGEARAFLLHWPDYASVTGPHPVIFNWHGLGDTAGNMAGLLMHDINNDVMPFILVTPDDDNLVPLDGLDWAILTVNDENKDVRLYDEIMVCLKQRFEIDENHIHTTGFSAGGIMSDALAVARADEIASVATYSGIYFSNPLNDTGIDNWAELETDNKFAQMLVHGGATDRMQVSLLDIRFNEMGINDVGYLAGKGHDVVHCPHGGGHTLPIGIRAEQLIQFFKDHPKGSNGTPYNTDGIPESFPSYCTVESKN